MSSYWTREERESWTKASLPDDHKPLYARTAYLSLAPEEFRRILATVYALEKIARHFDEHDCARMDGPPGPFPCEFCNTVTDHVLAALEAK